MKRLYFAVAALAIVCVWSHAATAVVITTYSDDLPGWQAASAGETLEDFADATLVPGFSITFGSDRPGSISGGEYHDRADNSQSTRPVLKFDPGIAAFGADWDLAGPTGQGTGIKLFVTFLDNSTQTVGTEIPRTFSGEFFGIVSDTAFKSIRIDEGTQTIGVETFDMDNARLASVIPEPCTFIIWSLLGAIAITVGWWRRRKR